MPAHDSDDTDVLLATSPNLSSLPFLDTETSHSKRTMKLNLNTPTDAEKLCELISRSRQTCS